MHSLPNDMTPESARRIEGAASAAVATQLRQLALPGEEWTVKRSAADGSALYDVLIIGGGMYGVSCAAELWTRGIRNILILDRSPAGQEGPWNTYARMPTLRSPKTLAGVSAGVAALSFPAWYQASFGQEAWEQLYKVPNNIWVEYICWVRETLALPMQNEVEVTRITPAADQVSVTCADGTIHHAKRLVIATGRAATGGWTLPDTVDPALLEAGLAAHTSQQIDFDALAGKRIAVIGAGASAWDNAATALEHGAAKVDMFCRRLALPQVNKGRAHSNAGFSEGWMALPDEKRWELTVYLDGMQAPPPHETVLRTCRHEGFDIHFGTQIDRATGTGEGIHAAISNGTEADYDFLILGTGFRVDLSNEPLFDGLAERIRLWSDCFTPAEPRALHLLKSPYLGTNFELLPKEGGSDPELSRIHLFNAAGYLSIGNLSLDVPTLHDGGSWLASKVLQCLFAEDFDGILDRLKTWQGEHELTPTPYFAPEFINKTARSDTHPNVVAATVAAPDATTATPAPKVAMRSHARSGLKFSELSLGAARWGEAPGEEGEKIVRQVFDKAWDAGIRYFDTAPFYGNGLCEHRLGEALRWKTRDDYLLSTKVGIDLDPHKRRTSIPSVYSQNLDFAPICDYSGAGIRSSFETSLHRLGISRADIAYMHGLSVCPNGLDQALDSGMAALVGLRDEGLLTQVGVGANTPEIAMKIIEGFDIDILLFAGGLSLVDHAGAEGVITACRERGIAVLSASPFGNSAFYSEENAGLRAKLAEVCARFDVSEKAAIIQFGLLLDCVVSVLWSTKTPGHIDGTVAAYAEEIPAAFWEACAEAGLIAPYILEA